MTGAMKGSLVLQHYETMAAKSREMLLAARESDWDTLVRLEQDCAAIVAELRRGGSARLTEAERKRKLEIIRGMLADDAEIRDLTEPWLAQLQRLIAGTSGQRKLARAYG